MALNEAQDIERKTRFGLFTQVVVGTVLGLAFGLLLPRYALAMHWATDIFMRLIIMAVGPLLFCIVVQGIVGAGSLRHVGRLGAKALLYFEAMTTVALLAAVGTALLLKPGNGISYVPAADDARTVASYAANAHAMQHDGLMGFLANIIPHSPISAFADGIVLQILFFAILFGCCLNQIGPAGMPITALINALNTLFARMMRVIIALAPLGVFGAMATTTARYGVGAILHLASFTVLYFVAIGVFIGIVLGLCLKVSGIRPLFFWRYLREELLITSTTTSSDSVLPSIMAKLEHMGVDRQVVGLVVPAGYSFNLDALSIYLGLSVLFLAQATHTQLGVFQILGMLATALLTSKGAHGVPGIAIVILAATLSATPSIPPASIVLLLAVDWFVGIARAIGNLAGNCVAPVVIAAWEGRLDRRRAAEVLGYE